MSLTLIPLLVNAVLVLLFIIVSAILVATGAVYGKHVGDNDVQTPLKWRILRLILFMIFIGLVMAIFNILIFEGFLIFQ